MHTVEGSCFTIQLRGKDETVLFLVHLVKVRQVVQYQISRKKLVIFIVLVNFIFSIWLNDFSRKE